MLFFLTFTLVVTFVIINVVSIARRNQKAHKFFQEKVANLPVVGNPNIFAGHLRKVIFINKNCEMITDLHNKLGSSFGFYMCDQPWIATKELDVIKKVFVDESHKHTNKCQLGLPIKEFNQSILTSGDEVWRRSRRAVAPALTNNKVRGEEVSEDIHQILNQLHQSLDNKIHEAEQRTGAKSFILHVDDVFQRFSLSVIFQIAYKQYNMIDFDVEREYWTSWIEEGLRGANNPLVTLCMMFPFIRPIGFLAIKYVAFGKVGAKIIDFLEKVLEMNGKARKLYLEGQKQKANTTNVDFSEIKSHGDFKRRMVDSIIDFYVDKKITRDDLMSNMWAMLIAGYLTTSDTLTCLVWQLARYPQVQEKLRHSIVHDGIDSEYVKWCIQEVIRFHPAVPLGPGRVLADDVRVNGQLFPKGVYLMASIYTIHHDKDIWKNPEEFIPERWRHENSHHPAAFMGFGLGPRNCPGGKLAVHEIKLAIQMLLSNYRIEKCDETASNYNFTCPLLVVNLLDQPIKVRLSSLHPVEA